MFVITKAGEIRLNESLATLQSPEGATFYSDDSEKDNPFFLPNFHDNFYEKLIPLFVPSFFGWLLFSKPKKELPLVALFCQEKNATILQKAFHYNRG